MNSQTIIAELAARHGTSINKDDPIFAAIMLNELILTEYLDKINIQINDSITNIAIKEDDTILKLKSLIEYNQLSHKKELDRTLKQFADNLNSDIHLSLNQYKDKPTSKYKIFSRYTITLLSGIGIGIITGFIL